jgi:hypothetical protein
MILGAKKRASTGKEWMVRTRAAVKSLQFIPPQPEALNSAEFSLA